MYLLKYWEKSDYKVKKYIDIHKLIVLNFHVTHLEYFFTSYMGKCFYFLEDLKVLPDEAVNVAFRDWNSNWIAYR